MPAPDVLYTIGHSTLSFEAFRDLLLHHGIECLADIRRFPGSRKYPHFNREALAASLAEHGIEYQWLEALGGRRGKQSTSASASVNGALRNESFRNYADYMATAAFHAGIEALLAIARRKVTAFMCSEAVYWRCHRRLVSDFLLARGIEVRHIMSSGAPRPHALTDGAVISNGTVTYPGQVAQ
jgi:uncharacterized protein (DUF488 family)